MHEKNASNEASLYVTFICIVLNEKRRKCKEVPFVATGIYERDWRVDASEKTDASGCCLKCLEGMTILVIIIVPTHEAFSMSSLSLPIPHDHHHENNVKEISFLCYFLKNLLIPFSKITRQGEWVYFRQERHAVHIFVVCNIERD